MTKLLVIGRIEKPISPDSKLSLDDLSAKLEKFGSVYHLAGLEGFVALLDVDNLETLDSILIESEFSKAGKIEILPLAQNR